MNVLITGGAGFIGSHLAERYLREQWNVSVLDDLSTGAMANIAPLSAYSNFWFRLGSVFDSELVAELVDQCDLIVHLAAAVGVRLIIESPVRTTPAHGQGQSLPMRHTQRSRLI